MDKALNPKLDTATIYEIYRACRLCGAGAGYKMPIVQNVVDIEEDEIELSKKIRDCVQLEVHPDDKMPPLICELCVDKVNDFYDFLEMCHQTNKQTRLKLGLPLQTSPRNGSNGHDKTDCILGVTEAIYVDDDSDVEPLLKNQSKGQPRQKPKLLVPKTEPGLKPKEPRFSYQETSTPGRETRNFRSTPQQERTLSKPLQETTETQVRETRNFRSSLQQGNIDLTTKEPVNRNKSDGTLLKSILRRDNNGKFMAVKTVNDTSQASKLKRPMEPEEKSVVTVKRVRLSSDLPQQNSTRQPSQGQVKIESRSARSSASPATSSGRSSPGKKTPAISALDKYMCPVCFQENRAGPGYFSHMKTHLVNYTDPKLACNPCGMWFLTLGQTATHHRMHTTKSVPYTCKGCFVDFRELNVYNDHMAKNNCKPYIEVPDVTCKLCLQSFPTNNLLKGHKCQGKSPVTGKCVYCNRGFAQLKNLKRHQSNCKPKKKPDKLKVAPEILKILKPVKVLLVRCDSLLTSPDGQGCNVSTLTQKYDSKQNLVYPRISSVRSLKIKSEPLANTNCMVNISNDITDDFCSEDDDFGWGKFDDDETPEAGLNNRRVERLAALALKALASQKLLGKVHKKYSQIKLRNVFDNDGEFGLKNIDKLLERLDHVEVVDVKDVVTASDVDESGINKEGICNSNDSKEELSDNIETNNDKENVNVVKVVSSVGSDTKMSNNDVCDDKVTANGSDNSDDILRYKNNLPVSALGGDEKIDLPKDTEENYSNDAGRTDNKTDELSCTDQEVKHVNGINDTPNESNTDLEDAKLMRDLDEQINDNSTRVIDSSMKSLTEESVDSVNNEGDFGKNVNADETELSENLKAVDEKLTLEDLLENRDSDLKSMELDSISDAEFDFNL